MLIDPYTHGRLLNEQIALRYSQRTPSAQRSSWIETSLYVPVSL